MDVLSRSLAVLALVCAIAAGTVGSTASTAGATAAAGDCSPGSDWGTLRADFAAQTVDLVNAHRATLGLRQLAVGSALQASAVWKARHMAKYGYMAHDDPAPPVARSVAERMAACGVTGGWGENIAAGYPTPAIRLQRLVGITRPSCEHREPELRLDGGGCGVERHGPDLLGAHVLVEWERVCSASASASASSAASASTGPAPVPVPVPAPPRRRRQAPSLRHRPAAGRSRPRRQRPCRRRIRSASAS